MSAWRYVDVAWQYEPGPWAPLPCQRCLAAPGTVAASQGRVWRVTLCRACAEVHREEHTRQGELFERREGEA